MKGKRFDHVANDLLVDIADISEGVVISTLGIDVAVARMVAIEIAMQVACEWGGRNIYIPCGNKIHVSNRDAEVYAMFTGGNIAEVARYFGISDQWAYKIIDRERKRERETKQRKLFD